MNSENPTPSMQERMDDLKETLKKEKVKLTPEVETYIQEHVRAVQDKLQNGEDVYEEDLAFIDEVKLWVGMPEEWRKKYASIGEMKEAEEVQAIYHEVNKRHISLKQWLDVLHVSQAAGKSMDWIDETFTFPGGGKIEVEGYLYLNGCTALTHLPEGLKVGRFLYLSGCTGLTTLPEGLKVGGALDLSGCTGLTSLPEGLEVEGNLFLTADLHEQVKKDAERLKAEGRIGGDIVYE